MPSARRSSKLAELRLSAPARRGLALVRFAPAPVLAPELSLGFAAVPRFLSCFACAFFNGAFFVVVAFSRLAFPLAAARGRDAFRFGASFLGAAFLPTAPWRTAFFLA